MILFKCVERLCLLYQIIAIFVRKWNILILEIHGEITEHLID